MHKKGITSVFAALLAVFVLLPCGISAAAAHKEQKSKAGIMWRSALIPGMGQFYNDEKAKGYIYSLGFLAGTSAIIKYTLDQQSAVDAYMNANTGFDEKYRAAEEANIKVYIAIGTTALVWGLSILDGYLTGSDNTKRIGFIMPDKNTAALTVSAVRF
ncbi:MAG TPA: hypothetical protein ENN43_03215 [bacterium]|nr:hypothetical protein [bacterium]